MNTLQKNKIEILVEAISAGQRLDRYLLSYPDIQALNLTRSFLQDLIDKKSVLVNGKNSKASYAVKASDRINIDVPAIVSTDLIPYEYNLDIVFEDDDLIVVNKPSGLVMHPAAGHEQDTLVNALLHHTQDLSMKNELRPGIVHRIDKETSGLVVIAKNDFIHEKLAQQFKNKVTHRVYYAVVEGHLKNPKGTVKSYLARHPTHRKRQASIKEDGKIKIKFDETYDKGKWAVTHYQSLQVSQNKSLVRLQLETGRTHQIRVHMSEMGHCLVGDIMYGYSVKKYNEQDLNRFFLHAAELGFTHPKTSEKIMFKTPWPALDQAMLLNWGFTLE